MKNFYTFILFFILAVVNGYFFNFINDYYFHIETKLPTGISQKEMAFLAVFVAPFLETLIFQYLLHAGLTKVLNVKSNLVCVLLMSFVFSQIHWYNWLYVIMTFFSGIILNSFYITFLNRTRYYFMLTVLFHALYNLYGVLFIPQ